MGSRSKTTAHTRTQPHHLRGGAFTLVELLVVIGIIGLLIAVLLPALNKARESARQVQCLSNMKQIATAIVSYCNDNKGTYPGRGGFGINNDSYAGNGGRETYYGWIAWRRMIDPVTGLPTGETNARADLNITYSALAKYMGVKRVTHSTPQEANTIAPKLEQVLRCPSDNLQARPAAGSGSAYRYSYSLNVLCGNKKVIELSGGGLGLGAYTPSNTTVRKITSVRRSSEKIVLICEDEQSINNGEYNPLATTTSDDPTQTKDYTAIAARHEMKNKRNSQDARGNVGFADGHAGFMSRRDVFSRKYFDPDF